MALLQAGYLAGMTGILVASLLVLSSLYHFSDTESKSDDNCFIGFPAIWNVVAFYIFAFDLAPMAAALFCLALVLLTFVPMHWAHPMRTPKLQAITILVMAAWSAAAFLVVWFGFPAPGITKVLLAAVAVYALGLTFVHNRPS